MVTLKELQNRVYSGKQCVQFEYVLKAEHPEDNLSVYFMKNQLVENCVWMVRVIMPRTKYKDTQVYSVDMEMPKADLSLTLICETGLRAFQMLIKEEIQQKSYFDFSIGEIIRGEI